MNKAKFSIPYNPELLKNQELREKFFAFLAKTHQHIKDIYFGYHIHPFSTDSRSGHFNSFNKEILADIHQIYLQYGIHGSPVFNGMPLTLNDNDYEIFTTKLQEILEYGIDSITLNAPLWVARLKRDFPNLKIKNSVVSPIGHPQELAYNYSEIEYDMLYVREDLIKDRDTLELDIKVRDLYKKEIGILMNHECCISFCPAKISHYASANKSTDASMFAKFCTDKEVLDMPAWYKRTYVFPLRSHYQWFYDNFDYLKMVGRSVVPDLLETMEIIDAFVNSEKDILFKNWFHRLLNNIKDKSKIKEFLEHHINCKNICCLCGYCDRMIVKELTNEKMYHSKSRT